MSSYLDFAASSRLNFRRIPAAWAQGRQAKAGALSTDGRRLMSYGMVIGTTAASGDKVAFDVPESNTTRRHMSGAKTVADLISPDLWHNRHCGADCEHVRYIEAQSY